MSRSLRSHAALLLPLLLAWLVARPAAAQVPALIGHQGRVMVSGAFFDGTGQFKFALVNATASVTFWRNSPDANNDGQPDTAVSLTVNKGLYSVSLGDTSMAQMAALSPSVLAADAVYLRVWFNDGPHGFQRLDPDHRVTAVGYALVASTVPDGSLGAEKLASGVLSFGNLSGTLGTSQYPPGLPAVSELAADPDLVGAGFRRFLTLPAAPWVNGTTTDAPTARSGHSGIWTGSQFVIWGGNLGPNRNADTGAAYEPQADRWVGVSTTDAPTARASHAAVWTGQEMIVWGGINSGGYPMTGGRYDPTRTTWRRLSDAGAPAGRTDAVVVWTGSRLVLFGGRNDSGILASGGVYLASSDAWSALALPNPPSARFGAAGVWSGSQWVLWGGRGTAGPLGDGARLSFAAGVPSAWSPVATLNAPGARTEHTAVWTGQRMVVWGGKGAGTDPYLADGASYDPATDAWTPLPAENAPGGRAGHAALWTGSEMLILGGENAAGLLASGHAYDPVKNRWRAVSSAGNPAPRRNASAVWSSTEVLIFGGQGTSGLLGLLQRLDPQATTHFYRKP